ncbi:MAG: hypothetical protein IPJ88_04820 [Myxococcales bacterium]|nr:MAG: hypothetical protein IPJ88_04820 [Myxococcales bacterium]
MLKVIHFSFMFVFFSSSLFACNRSTEDLCQSDNPPAGCFVCTSDDDCEGETPVCDIPNNTCVECKTNAECSGETPQCNTTSQTCVACLDSTHCTDAAAPVCDTTTNTCTGCTENTDCDGITGKPFCKNESCVQCTVENEDVCNGNSCNPNTFECTTTKLNDVATCEPCVTDTECITDHKCVPMLYQENNYGTFCMKLESANCGQPYKVILSKKSVLAAENDTTELFCGINEDLNTCDAMLAFNTECNASSICVVDGKKSLALSVAA